MQELGQEGSGTRRHAASSLALRLTAHLPRGFAPSLLRARVINQTCVDITSRAGWLERKRQRTEIKSSRACRHDHMNTESGEWPRTPQVSWHAGGRARDLGRASLQNESTSQQKAL